MKFMSNYISLYNYVKMGLLHSHKYEVYYVLKLCVLTAHVYTFRNMFSNYISDFCGVDVYKK